MEELIRVLQNERIDVVTSEKIISDLGNYKYIQDARSAAFFAFGKALKEKKTIALVIDGAILTNVLTAVTESWFQKANVIVIALYNQYSEVKSEFFQRCVIEWKTIDRITSEMIKAFEQKRGPVLINMLGISLEQDCLDYGKIPEWLQDKTVYLYNSYQNHDGELVRNIGPEYRYGVISRYMGITAVAEQKTFLCCSAECVLLDLNVFNNRYSANRSYIIILDQEGIIEKNQIDKWIASNGIKCKFVDEIEKKYVELMKNSDEAMVLVIRKAVM